MLISSLSGGIHDDAIFVSTTKVSSYTDFTFIPIRLRSSVTSDLSEPSSVIPPTAEDLDIVWGTQNGSDVLIALSLDSAPGFCI